MATAPAEATPDVLAPVTEGSESSAVVPRPPRASAPATIGNFRVLCPLGSGGMARVYLCQTRGLGGFEKLVVLKVPQEGMMAADEVHQMFLHEARVAGRLNHSNIVQTNEVGLADGLPFIAMEYLEGQSLASLQKEVRLAALSTPLQLRILSQALAGCHHAHEMRKPDGTSYDLVHRDISPPNIFITYDGVTKILDFGIAKVNTSDFDQTRGGVIKGKLAYMAPEQAAAMAVDRRADIFAFGVMIWEAITHRRFVLREQNEYDVLRDRITGAEPRVDSVVPDADPELVAICSKAMARLPAERYQTALELKMALDRYLARVPGALDEDIGAYVRNVFAEQRIAFRARVDEALRRSDQDLENSRRILPSANDETAPGASVTASRQTAIQQPLGARAAWKYGVGGAAGMAAIAAVILFGTRQQQTAEVQRPTVASDVSPAPVPVTSAATAAQPSSVHVELHAHPSTAQISVDGVAAPGAVYVRELAPKAEPRKIKVTAPGYATLEREIVFNRDLMMDLSLDELKQPAKPGAGKRTGSTVADVAPSTPAPKARTGSKIDESDPYR